VEAWLVPRVFRLKEIRRNTDKGNCLLHLSEKDVKHTHITGLFRNWILEDKICE
jgi:hypothetical protein